MKFLQALIVGIGTVFAVAIIIIISIFGPILMTILTPVIAGIVIAIAYYESRES